MSQILEYDQGFKEFLTPPGAQWTTIIQKALYIIRTAGHIINQIYNLLLSSQILKIILFLRHASKSQ